MSHTKTKVDYWLLQALHAATNGLTQREIQKAIAVPPIRILNSAFRLHGAGLISDEQEIDTSSGSQFIHVRYRITSVGLRYLDDNDDPDLAKSVEARPTIIRKRGRPITVHPLDLFVLQVGLEQGGIWTQWVADQQKVVIQTVYKSLYRLELMRLLEVNLLSVKVQGFRWFTVTDRGKQVLQEKLAEAGKKEGGQ